TGWSVQDYLTKVSSGSSNNNTGTTPSSGGVAVSTTQIGAVVVDLSASTDGGSTYVVSPGPAYMPTNSSSGLTINARAYNLPADSTCSLDAGGVVIKNFQTVYGGYGGNGFGIDNGGFSIAQNSSSMPTSKGTSYTLTCSNSFGFSMSRSVKVISDSRYNIVTANNCPDIYYQTNPGDGTTTLPNGWSTAAPGYAETASGASIAYSNVPLGINITSCYANPPQNNMTDGTLRDNKLKVIRDYWAEQNTLTVGGSQQPRTYQYFASLGNATPRPTDVFRNPDCSPIDFNNPPTKLTYCVATPKTTSYATQKITVSPNGVVVSTSDANKAGASATSNPYWLIQAGKSVTLKFAALDANGKELSLSGRAISVESSSAKLGQHYCDVVRDGNTLTVSDNAGPFSGTCTILLGIDQVGMPIPFVYSTGSAFGAYTGGSSSIKLNSVDLGPWYISNPKNIAFTTNVYGSGLKGRVNFIAYPNGDQDTTTTNNYFKLHGTVNVVAELKNVSADGTTATATLNFGCMAGTWKAAITSADTYEVSNYIPIQTNLNGACTQQ
ncbi:hypothetical protein K2P96_01370, partial [Patescibacteria group bacterium]|nr:hypothetical protein [Patescibacteria group bacterium]